MCAYVTPLVDDGNVEWAVRYHDKDAKKGVATYIYVYFFLFKDTERI
jgi:hypothetical protein